MIASVSRFLVEQATQTAMFAHGLQTSSFGVLDIVYTLKYVYSINPSLFAPRFVLSPDDAGRAVPSVFMEENYVENAQVFRAKGIPSIGRSYAANAFK